MNLIDGVFPENIEELIEQPLAFLPEAALDEKSAVRYAVEELWPNILVNGKFKIKWSRVKKENGWDVKCYITDGLGERREFDESLVPAAIQRPWAQEYHVCPRMFELWVRLDDLNVERARRASERYEFENLRMTALKRVDGAIKKVIGALKADSTGIENTDSSTAYRRHQQRAARAKAEKERPRIAANRKHMRDAWLSGKYTTKDLCAEQEAESIGITFSTAREYLRGLPQPAPWPARGLN